MKYLPILLIFTTLSLFAQQKGVTPITPAGGKGPEGTTRAVIVGISDYQNDDIPDLRFADKDAEAFVKYLQSPGGGSVSEENIKLLTNSDATMAAVASELDWLVEESEEGDKAIIYFSGHGDVEAKTMSQPGFLLTYDSPPKIYIAGAYPLFYLQLIIQTLSTQKNVQTLVITDACRAGKLAGSEIGGTQATAANLAKQYGNEIKILSCQPDEFSLEGEQWGGGRGAFSYHLIEGMIGLADKNENGNVNLLELENYLESIVPEETNPQSQIPMTVGSKGTKVAWVDAEILAKLKDLKANQLPTLAAIESRGMEETVLATADSSVQKMYEAFIAALDNDNLLDAQNGNPSADDLYQQLIAEESIESLHRFMTRKLATALQDDAQQAINAYLLANPAELEKRWKGDSTYSQYPRYLGRAAELLGKSHYMHNYLIAKQLYFEGLNLRLEANKSDKRDSLYFLAMEKQKAAVELENRAAYFYNELGVLHTQLKLDLKAFEYYDKAIELAPEWALPYANYAVGLYYNGDIEKAIEYGEKAGELSGEFPQIYSFLAWIYANNWDWADKQSWNRTGTELQDRYEFELDNISNIAQVKKRLEKSIQLLQKAIELDTFYINAYYNLGFLFQQIKKYDKAIFHFKKAAELDSLNAQTFGWIAANYRSLTNNPEAKKYYLKAISLDSTTSNLYNNLALVYGDLGRPDKAIHTFKKSLRIDPTWHNYTNIGYQYARKNLLQKSESFYLKGILFNKGFYSTYPAQFANAGQLYMENLKRYDVAADLFQLALDIKPDYVYALKNLAEARIKMGQPEAVSPIIEQLKKMATDNFYLYFELAGIYLKMGKKEKAIQILREKVNEKADDPDVLRMAAWEYQYHYEIYDEAEALFKKSLALGGDTIYCYSGLGYTYLRDGKPEKAWEYFQKMLERGSLTPYNIYHIACYYSVSGQLEPAIEWLEKTLQKGSLWIWTMQTDKDFIHFRDTPEYQALVRKYYPEVFTAGGLFNLIEKEEYYLENCVLLARIYESHQMGDKAIEMYQKAVELKTDTLSDIEKMALTEAYLKLGQFEKAQAVCPAGIESDDSEDWYNAAITLYHAHKNDRAKIHFEKYLENSKNPVSSLKVATHYYYNSEPELTEQYFQSAIELHPDNYNSSFYLAFLYLSFGEGEKAVRVIDKALEKFPTVFNLKIAKAFTIAYTDTPENGKKAFAELDEFHPGILKVFDCLTLMKEKNFEAAEALRTEINEAFAGTLVPLMLNFGYLKMLSDKNDFDTAMELIEKDPFMVFSSYQFLMGEPALAPLRETERFKAFMQRQFPGKMY